MFEITKVNYKTIEKYKKRTFLTRRQAMSATKRNRFNFNCFQDSKIANIEELPGASPPRPLRRFHLGPSWSSEHSQTKTCPKTYVTEAPPKLAALDQLLPSNFKEDALDCEFLVPFPDAFVIHTEELNYFQ